MLQEAWLQFRSNAGVLYRALGVVLVWALGIMAGLVGLSLIHPVVMSIVALLVVLFFAPRAQAALIGLAIGAARGTASMAEFWELGAHYSARFLGLMLLQGVVAGALGAVVQDGPQWVATGITAIVGISVTVSCLDSMVTKSGFWQAVGKGVLIWRKPLAVLGLIAVVSVPPFLAGMIASFCFAAAVFSLISAFTVVLGVVATLFAVAYEPFAQVYAAVWYFRHVPAQTEPDTLSES